MSDVYDAKKEEEASRPEKRCSCIQAGLTWVTSRDIAREAGIAERTARAHALKFVRLGIADQAEVFPAHRYRLAAKAAKRNVGYLQRLDQTCEVFGLKR